MSTQSTQFCRSIVYLPEVPAALFTHPAFWRIRVSYGNPASIVALMASGGCD
jgi:hypothetical protein